MRSDPKGGKIPFNFRLTPAGKVLLVKLGEQMGLTRSGVMETAIRLLAKEQGIPSGQATREELDDKWNAFMAEDEMTRTVEIEKDRSRGIEEKP